MDQERKLGGDGKLVAIVCLSWPVASSTIRFDRSYWPYPHPRSSLVRTMTAQSYRGRQTTERFILTRITSANRLFARSEKSQTCSYLMQHDIVPYATDVGVEVFKSIRKYYIDR